MNNKMKFMFINPTIVVRIEAFSRYYVKFHVKKCIANFINTEPTEIELHWRTEKLNFITIFAGVIHMLATLP